MRSARWVVTGLLVLGASPVVFSADSNLLFRPQPTEATVAPASPEEGILVTGVTIREGDTLKRLARKYRGRSSYFPQILLFNKIANPDRIRAGERLLVPVTAKEPSSTHRRKKVRHHRRTSLIKTAVPPAMVRPTLPAADPSLVQYRRAVTAYEKRQFGQALREFDRFLADFPQSPLAAEASLYRANCLLDLSQQ